MISAAIYARVSSGKQEQERTIESQVAAIDAFVAEHDWEVLPAHRFIDDGWSGHRLARPALDRLRDAALLQQIDILVLYDADRLARRFVDQQVVLEELKARGVEVHYVTGSPARTAEERMLESMKGVFAEYERTKILDRTRRGWLHRALQGRPPSWSNPPYGYRVVSSGKEQTQIVVVEECEATLVRQIFGLVADDGLSLRAVCARLQGRKLLTRSGKEWMTATLSKMLRNPIYVGRAYHQKYESVEPQHRVQPGRYHRNAKSSQRKRPVEQWLEVKVPALVSEATFERASERLGANRRRTAGQSHHPYLLRGLLVCSLCGRKMTARTLDAGKSAERGYYSCNLRGRHNALDVRRCEQRMVRGEDIDAAVWADLASWLQEPKQLSAQLAAQQEQVRTVADAVDSERKRVGRELQRAEESWKRLLDGYEAGLVSLDEARARQDRIREQRERLEEQREQLGARSAWVGNQQNVVTHLEELRERLARGAERCSWADKRRIVELLVEKVEVEGPELKVHYVVELEPPTGGRVTATSNEERPAESGVGTTSSTLCQPCNHEGSRSRRQHGSSTLPLA
jgi:site-specific DNA recombinase